jgi:GTP-binding protein
MFIDEIKIFARAGHGGKGCVAFRRESHVPKGGPSGGDGGRGGHVILEACHDINNLIAQFYKPRLHAQNGEPGMGKDMSGHSGKDLIIKVPCGTLVWRVPTPVKDIVETPIDNEFENEGFEDFDEDDLDEAQDEEGVMRQAGAAQALEIDLANEPEEESETEEVAPPKPKTKIPDTKQLVVDMVEDGQQFVLCDGGRGGQGNIHFTTARRQAPRIAQPGEPGDEGEYWFELRILAQIGLVGYPNAGKSTLLTAVSRARPKVAPYPFTTLHPQMGIMEFHDYTRLTVCDIPGIIEGAHMNVGLGHAFLRHINRCKALVILLDMAGTDDREPWDDYEQLLSELSLYDEGLLDRPRFIAANKMDEEAATEKLETFKNKYPELDVLPMSAAFDVGTEEFKLKSRAAVEKMIAEEAATAQAEAAQLEAETAQAEADAAAAAEHDAEEALRETPPDQPTPADAPKSETTG